MTDDEIIHLTDAYAPKYDGLWSFTDLALIAFARAIVAKEREACAKVVDAEMDDWDSLNVDIALNNVAAEIRAKGE